MKGKNFQNPGAKNSRQECATQTVVKQYIFVGFIDDEKNHGKFMKKITEIYGGFHNGFSRVFTACLSVHFHACFQGVMAEPLKLGDIVIGTLRQST